MDFQQLNEAIKGFDDTGLGRCFAILATLAEQGLETQALGGIASTEVVSDDPLWPPAKAAEYLSISTATLRQYRKRYSMDSLGSGKSRRYRKSEIERVIELRNGG